MPYPAVDSIGRILRAALLVIVCALPASGAEPDAPRARQLTGEAYRAFSAGNFPEALKTIDEALRLAPDSAHAFVVRGLTRAGAGDIPAGLADLNRAVELAPDLAFARLMRGWVRIDAADPDGALEDFASALRFAPECTPAIAGRAMALLSKGDLDAAVAEGTSVIEGSRDSSSDTAAKAIALLDQTDLLSAIRQAWSTEDWGDARPVAYEARARARAAQALHAEAIADLDEAIRLRPQRVVLWTTRATSRATLGRGREALADAQHACELAPKLADAHLLTAVIAAQLREADTVRTHAKAAIELSPKNVTVLLGAAKSLTDVGALDEAAAALTQALKVDPAHIGATRALFDLRLIKPDVAGADADLVRALQARLPATELGLMRGKLLLLQGDTSGAMREFKIVLDADPRNMEARLLRTEIRLARRDPIGADEELQRGIEALPESIELHIERAQLQLTSLDDRLARRLADRARAIDPNHPRVLLFDSYLALCDGDWARAIDCCERARRTAPTSMQLVFAIALLEAGDAAQAATVLAQTSLDGAPDAFLDALRACTRIATGRVDEAIVLLETVVAGDDSSLADYRLDLAVCQWYAGRPADAAATLRAGKPAERSIELAWLRLAEGRTMPIWDDTALTTDERLALSELERYLDGLVPIALKVDAPANFRGSAYLPGRRARATGGGIDAALLLACVQLEKNGPPEKLRRLLESIGKSTPATGAAHHLAALWLAKLPPPP